MKVNARLKWFVNFITTSNTFIAIVVLLVGIAATLVSWQEARQTVSTKIYNTLTQSIDDTDEAIQKRVAIYEEVLYGTGGLFAIRGDAISRPSFTRYAAQLSITERFPGLLGIGFGPVVPADTVAAHESTVRADGIPGYTIYPAGSRSMYVPVMYLDPIDTGNRQVLGYDMYNDPARKRALDAARDSGNPTITDTVQLVQTSVSNGEKGFIYYLPVYNAPSHTVESRRANIIGFVFVPVKLSDLMASIFKQEAFPDISMSVYDNQSTDATHLVYQSSQQAGDISANRTIKLGDHIWNIKATGSAGILSAQERQQPFMVFILGAGASFLLAAFIFIVMRSRARELAYQKQLDIQQAKDDLLSLASHQLRTPATGVKQYLGIVLEGYTGAISNEQKQMLLKANESNERQLDIVNQLLHVTRLETGRLMLRFADCNIANLVEDIISEQSATISNRDQTLTFAKPLKPVRVLGDEQYLRMAIENLISNASKYTHAGGTITVALVNAPDRITLTISDTGVGIDPADFDKLFQKFSRIDNELSVQAGGSGIGLYLTREIIELHGGSILVDSEWHAGASFTIILPKRTGKTTKV